MRCFSDVIEAFGVAPMAELLGVPDSHVRVMKARNSIPADYWSRIVKAAEDRGIDGVSADSLVAMREERFGRGDTAA